MKTLGALTAIPKHPLRTAEIGMYEVTDVVEREVVDKVLDVVSVVMLVVQVVIVDVVFVVLVEVRVVTDEVVLVVEELAVDVVVVVVRSSMGIRIPARSRSSA